MPTDSSQSRTPLARAEAERRAGIVSDVDYHVALDLQAGAKTYRGDTTVTFSAQPGEGTFLEFRPGVIERAELNGGPLGTDAAGGRVDLAGELLRERNELRIVYENEYDHTGEGFHQFVDPEDGAEYLYTQFEPYSAHRLFPCFDQPDIKATYELEVTAPEEWEVVSAGRLVTTAVAGEGRTRRSYEQTVRFSPYLFSVIAGPYAAVHDSHQGLPLGIYCRESFFRHLDADNILDVTKRGLDWFAEFFGKPYPFTKYDQLFVPEFNWGGMENVAAVTYTDNLIFRDPPTMPMLVRRAEVLLHELAHMWFGNLVTMRWWDDLWLNESFATFAAYLAMDGATDFPDVWQDFHNSNKPGAYRADQLPTTHPIVAEVETTDDVFLNFDEITYGKGASSLRQLVAAIGDDAFRRGLQTYFRRHEFGNTTLADFLAALQEGAGQDLVRWAARWLKTAGVNTLSVEWDSGDIGMTSMRLRQSAPDTHPTLRPHTVEIAVVDEGTDGGVRIDALPAQIDQAAARVEGVVGRSDPWLVFPNHRDLTYAKVALDPASVDFVRVSLPRIEDPLFRQLLWTSLWEMVRDQQLPSPEFLDIVDRHLASEQNVPIVKEATARAVAALRRYVPDAVEDQARHDFVQRARAALDTAPPGDARVYWARALIAAATRPEDLMLAGRIVDGEEAGEGLSIDQDMRWAVAVRWVGHGVDGAQVRIDRELERDPSDRGRRAVIRAEASRPDAAIKEEVWAKIHQQGYASLFDMVAAMGGFGWRSQAELLAPYVDGFFERVEGVFAEWEFEAAKSYFHGLFPEYRIHEGTLARTVAMRDRVPAGSLRRLLAEEAAEMERALAVRELAAATLPGPREGDNLLAGSEPSSQPAGR